MGQTILYSAAIVIIFGIIIVFHEAGHFFVAKMKGIKIHEFALGMGPVLFSVTRKETQYSLRIVPVGGFVRVAGMEPDDPDPEGFNSKPWGQRTAVIAAGPIMNILLAAIIFFLIYGVFGIPSETTNVVEKAITGKPAAAAGIQSGDRLVSVNGVPSEVAPALLNKAHTFVKELKLSPERSNHTWETVRNSMREEQFDKMREQIQESPGKPVALVLLRNGKQFTLSVVPEKKRITQEPELDKQGEMIGAKEVNKWIGQIGVVFQFKREHLSLGSAMMTGVQQTWDTISGILQGFGWIFQGKAKADVAGPVGIVTMMYEQAQSSWLSFLQFAGMFNVMIAFMNLLPFPALDGSRIVFIIIEAIRRRPIDPRKEALVHTVGLVILLLLVLLVTVNDIWIRWIKPQ